MVVFINYLTGTEMLVADERKEEYIKAGFVPAFAPVEIAKPSEPKDVPEKKPKATTRKKK